MRITPVALLVAIASGCGGAGSGGSSWAGSWSCDIKFTENGASTSTTGTVTITETSGGELSITPTADAGNSSCPFSATVSGDSGTFTSTQACGRPGITYGGSLTLNGASLTFTITATNTVMQSVTETAACTRQ